MKNDDWMIIVLLFLVIIAFVFYAVYIRSVWTADLPWWLKLKLIGG